MKQSNKILALAIATSIMTPAIVAPVAPLAANVEVKNVSFKDMKTTHWAMAYVAEGVQKGYIGGYADNTFKPEQTVTNAEFIKMLATALNPTAEFKSESGANWYVPYLEEALKSGLVKEGDFSNYNAKMKRIDLAKLGARGIGQDTTNNKEWMYIATSKGLINGVDSKGTLKEQGTMTRAQAAAMISRVLQVNEGKKLAVDANAVANAKELMNTVFTDIKKHWASKTILKAVDKGYVSGYQDSTFRPDHQVSNAEFIKMLVTALQPNNSIEAVSGSKWYEPYMEAAIEMKLVKANEFKDVNAKMTRNDLAKLGARGIGETSNTDNKKWMYIATKAGLINGVDSKGTLKENGTMTRAQAVTMIERVIATKNGEKLPVDKYAVANAEIVWHKTNIFTMVPQWFKPNKIDEINMSDSALTSIVENGNVTSKTNKLIAIDLDDPKDPYRYLLKDKKLYSYDAINDKKNYYDIDKSKNGYVFLSLNDLTIKNTSTITQTAIDGANLRVGLQSLNNEYLPYTKGVVNKDGSSSIIVIKKGQSKKHYEYSMGTFISKDFAMTEGRGITVFFDGLINWGGNNSGGRYMDYNY